ETAAASLGSPGGAWRTSPARLRSRTTRRRQRHGSTGNPHPCRPRHQRPLYPMNDDSQPHEQQASWIARLRDVFTDNVDDTDELIRVLRKAQRKKVLDTDALSIIEGALQVADMQVRDI